MYVTAQNGRMLHHHCKVYAGIPLVNTLASLLHCYPLIDSAVFPVTCGVGQTQQCPCLYRSLIGDMNNIVHELSYIAS